MAIFAFACGKIKKRDKGERSFIPPMRPTFVLCELASPASGDQAGRDELCNLQTLRHQS
jgi:hypothetical protein